MVGGWGPAGSGGGRCAEGAGAGHGGAVGADGFAGGLDDVGVAGEAEGVVGAEHEDATAVDAGFGAVVTVEGLKEGVKLGGAGLIDKGELVGFGEDVAGLAAVVAVPEHSLDAEGRSGAGRGLGGACPLSHPF